MGRLMASVPLIITHQSTDVAFLISRRAFHCILLEAGIGPKLSTVKSDGTLTHVLPRYEAGLLTRSTMYAISNETAEIRIDGEVGFLQIGTLDGIVRS